MSIRFSLLASLFSLSLVASAGCGAPVNLTVKSYSSDATFAVGSYLLTGNQDAILVDGQFTKGDAEKVVAMVKESGKTLRAIFLTHAPPRQRRHRSPRPRMTPSPLGRPAPRTG